MQQCLYAIHIENLAIYPRARFKKVSIVSHARQQVEEDVAIVHHMLSLTIFQTEQISIWDKAIGCAMHFLKCNVSYSALVNLTPPRVLKKASPPSAVAGLPPGLLISKAPSHPQCSQPKSLRCPEE